LRFGTAEAAEEDERAEETGRTAEGLKALNPLRGGFSGLSGSGEGTGRTADYAEQDERAEESASAKSAFQRNQRFCGSAVLL